MARAVEDTGPCDDVGTLRAQLEQMRLERDRAIGSRDDALVQLAEVQDAMNEHVEREAHIQRDLHITLKKYDAIKAEHLKMMWEYLPAHADEFAVLAPNATTRVGSESERNINQLVYTRELGQGSFAHVRARVDVPARDSAFTSTYCAHACVRSHRSSWLVRTDQATRRAR